MYLLDETIKSLEFDKILSLLSDYLVCKKNVDNINNLKPYNTYLKAYSELNKTKSFYEKILLKPSLNFLIIEDLTNIFKRLEKDGVLSIDEILYISNFLHNIKLLKDWKSELFFNESEQIALYIDKLTYNEDLHLFIKNKISNDKIILDTATENLLEIRKSIINVQNNIRDTIDNIIKKENFKKYLADNIVTIKNDRFTIPIKSEYRNKVNGIVHQSSSTGITLFIEPIEVFKKGNLLRSLIFDEKIEIENILKNISKEILSDIYNLKLNYKSFLKLDFCIAKAKLAIEQNATFPILKDNNYINLKNARHPLINKEDVVPINIYIGRQHDTLIITGPNTGGKTVSMKTLGLCTLMALSGMFITCDEESEVSFFNNIFVDIGDNQSIENNLSTFSSHIKNIINIIKYIDNKSLVILDEIGSGTDPIEGSALAISIIEYLRNKGSTILASTHYNEVKLYAIDTVGVENASCYFDLQYLKPTYKLIIGVPGSSNAFKISEKLGLDDSILKYGENILKQQSKDLENSIRNIEKTKMDLEIEKINIENIKNQAIKEKKRQEEIRINLEKDYNNQKEKNRQKLDYEIDKLIVKSNKIFEELEYLQKNKNIENSKKLKTKIDKDLDSIVNKFGRKKNLKSNLTIDDIKIGQDVFLIDIQKHAVVVSIPNKIGILKVSFGSITTETNINNLTIVKDKKTSLKSNVLKNFSISQSSYTTEINVIGKNSEEAILEIDKFIDQSLILNMEIINIIHGKGTGILRKSVHKYLKKHKNVSEFRLGSFGEGEDGVTIVKLR